MSKPPFINIISGMNMIIRQSKENFKKSSQDYIEKNIIKGQYVSREEYNQLSELVLKLQKELNEIKDKKLS